MRIRIGEELEQYKNDPRVVALESMISKRNWDTWLTFTFRHPTFKETAIRDFKRFFKYHLPNTIDSTTITSYIVLEGASSRLGVHIHALIRGINESQLNDVRKKWRKKFGNSKVDMFDKDLNGSWYLARKYIKPSYVDDGFYTINRRVFK